MLDECNSEERISCPGAKNRRINTLAQKSKIEESILTLQYYNKC